MKRMTSVSVLVVLLFANHAFGQGVTIKRPVTFAGGVVVGTLPTTEREAQYPVCFNGAGELLPCNSLVEPPTPPGEPQSLDGLWFGTMLADARSSGNYTCYDADVLISIIYYTWYSSNYRIVTMTLDRDDSTSDNVNWPASAFSDGQILNNYIANEFNAFSDRTSFNLLFNDYGYAEGTWSEQTSGCHGFWSFLKM